ncbi:hypothetical protein ACWEIJ_20275 [Lentzea sp. NPDC004789]
MSRDTEPNQATLAQEFLAATAAHLGVDDLRDLPLVSELPPAEARRVRVEDPRNPTPDELDALAAGFHSRFGMVAFECATYDVGDVHPLIHLGDRLRDRMPCRWPIDNFEDVADRTTKIRDTGPDEGKPRALSNQALAAHQDGWLSLRGVIAVTGLCADSAPPSAAVTYSQNVVRLGLDLWRRDEPAFTRLFAPGAVVVVRRSDGLRHSSPVLEVHDGQPRGFFRGVNDEFDVLPGDDDPATGRAVAFMIEHTGEDAPGSCFTRLDRPGRGFLLDNRQCVHGRTAFVDGDEQHEKRVIASKWWAAEDRYKDVHWGAPEVAAAP